MMQQLILPATLESLAAIRAYAKAAAEAAGLSSKAAYRLVLAVDEVASNIALHAYTATAAGTIEVHAHIDAARLSIRIEDTGAPYLPDAQPPDDIDVQLEDRRLGGLGLLLARQVDEFRYERRGERNRHTLIMDRGGGKS